MVSLSFAVWNVVSRKRRRRRRDQRPKGGALPVSLPSERECSSATGTHRSASGVVGILAVYGGEEVKTMALVMRYPNISADCPTEQFVAHNRDRDKRLAPGG